MDEEVTLGEDLKRLLKRLVIATEGQAKALETIARILKESTINVDVSGEITAHQARKDPPVREWSNL